MKDEAGYVCDSCGEEIILPIDLSAGSEQGYVEDWRVCCCPHLPFVFADDRIIPRFHLEGVEAGRRVSVSRIDPGTGERLGLLATATVGEGGWVDLAEPIRM